MVFILPEESIYILPEESKYSTRMVTLSVPYPLRKPMWKPANNEIEIMLNHPNISFGTPVETPLWV